MPELILASTSPFRQRMLRDAGLRVRAVAPGVDEDPRGETDPVALVRALAVRKARAVSRTLPEAWVLGADQVAYDPGAGSRPIGKPADPADHLRQLRAMRGRSHVLVTGFALLGPGIEQVDHEQTILHVRPDVSDEELQAYVATGEGSGCAGGYAAEGRGAFLFSRIEGDFFNVLGLPLLRVFDLLRAHGWRFST